MKKFVIAAAVVATMAGAAGAASAQPYRGDRDRYDGPRYDAPRYGSPQSNAINAKQQLLRERIARGERAGQITPREARQLRTELRNISVQERQFRASNGIDPREYSILSTRIERLTWRVSREARDGESYGYGYGDRGGNGYGYDRR